MSVGFPAHLYLNLFGQVVEEGFGHAAYLVGSAAKGKGWRDVDVVVIVDDDEFAAMFPGAVPGRYSFDPRWRSVCLAYSALGERMTGLPIDFKVQQQSHANSAFDGPREALILNALTRRADR